jgi:hypothetical protein
MAWGVHGDRRDTPETAVRPFQRWLARRAQKGRAWQTRVKLLGVHGHPLPYVMVVDNLFGFLKTTESKPETRTKKLSYPSTVAHRGGDRGHKVTGPGAPAGSREAREDHIMCIKWGPGKAKSCAPEGPRKVIYGHDPAVFWL